MGQIDQLMRDAVTASKDMPVDKAIDLMTSNAVTVVTVTQDSRVVGIFTLGDAAIKVLRRRLDPARTRLEEVMTSPVSVATPKTTIREAIDMMLTHQIHHVPVTDIDGVILGVISLHYLLKTKVRNLEIENLALSNYIGAETAGD